MTKDLEYYLNLPWSYSIEYSDVDKCFLGSIKELEKNMTNGETQEECFFMLKDALKAYILTSLAQNLPINEPIRQNDFKGKIPYRTTSNRHYRLAKKAGETGKSINKLVDEAVEYYLNNQAV